MDTTPITAASASAFTQGQAASQVGSAVAVLQLSAERQAASGDLQLLAAATGQRPSTAAVNGIGGHVDVGA